MKRYLLPCSCSRRIAVTQGQAGGTVVCPSCQATLAVPRLGLLGCLDVEGSGPSAAGARVWNTARACLLAGVAMAVVGAAAAGWLHVRRAGIASIDEQAIRSSMAAASSAKVYERWLEFERRGIVGIPLGKERLATQRALRLEWLEFAAWILAATGAAVAVGAAFPALRPPRRCTAEST